MRILRIGPPHGRLGYQRVALDGGPALRVRPADVTALGLTAGAELDAAAITQLRAAAGRALAEETAYRLLAVRLRSRQELIGRLRRRGIASEIVDAVAAHLEAQGLLDDRRFARAWIQSRMALHRTGPLRLRHELAGKGVAREVIAGALGEALNDTDEGALALQVARARLRRYRGLPRDVIYRRLAGVLQRRGFSTAAISRILRDVLGTPLDHDG